MNKTSLLTTLLLGLLIGTCNSQESEMKITLSWDRLPVLSAAHPQSRQYGLAGPLTGMASDHLIVAGGANFPDAPPWLGGAKTYYDHIYYLNITDEQQGWRVSETRLPEPLAYTASVSVHDEIYSVGGENPEGPLSLVLKVNKSGTGIHMERLTDYPAAISNSGAASIGTFIYVAGGMSKDGAVPLFYRADISQNKISWERLPDLPVAVSNAVVVAQSDGKEKCIYVLGGRKKSSELTSFFSEVWKYSPVQDNWLKAGEISSGNRHPVKLAAGTGMAWGEKYIFLFGGDNGDLFNKTERMIQNISEASDSTMKQELMVRKNNHLNTHPGFERDIIVFNTLSNKCSVAGIIPGPAQVTTSAVRVGNTVIIPSGEIRPGVRTPGINLVSIETDHLEEDPNK